MNEKIGSPATAVGTKAAKMQIDVLRKKISFVLIRSVVACLRGERSSRSFTPEQAALTDPKLTEILTSMHI